MTLLQRVCHRVKRGLNYAISKPIPGFNIHDPEQFQQLINETNVEPINGTNDRPDNVLRETIARFMKLPYDSKQSLNRYAEELAQSDDLIAEPLRQALATNPTGLPKRIWEMRSDLRQVFPLGLTVHQLRLYAVWLLTHGRDDFSLQPGQVLWYLFELAEHPTQALVNSYLRQPQWQEFVPDALTQEGWPRLIDWLSATYGLQRSWLATLKPAYRPSATHTLGVNILGNLRYHCGLREDALAVQAALQREGIPSGCRHVFSEVPSILDNEPEYNDLENYPITVIPNAANFSVDHFYTVAGLHIRPEVYRIVFWAWELESFPVEYLHQSKLVDEIWTVSEFVASAIRKVTDRPVLAMPRGVPIPMFEPLPRSHFGLREGRFIFHFSFDMGSMMQRKNPLGLIQAFRKAFDVTEPVDLVIKVMRGTSDPHNFQRLQTEAEQAGAIVIDRLMPREESFALMNLCDCYISLHRAEGFGLTVAEAMHMGKPLICTDYAGTNDYLDAETARLIPYSLVPIGEGHAPYSSTAFWAEPDLHEAAQAMRWVYDHPAEAQAMGSRAKVAAATRLDTIQAGRRIADRIRAIYEGLQ